MAFKESEATEKFVLLINNMFDILNSRNEKNVWLVWIQKNHDYGDEENKKTTKKMVKTERDGSIQDLINAINSDMKHFLINSYNISHQYK